MKDAKIEKFNKILNDQSVIWGDYAPTDAEMEHFTFIPEIWGWRIDWPEGQEGMVIGTHSQGFHADDLLSVLLLKEELCPGAKIIRSRDKDELAKADFLPDVGEGLLDHHGSRANREARISALTRVFWGLVNNFIVLPCDGSGQWIVENHYMEYCCSRLLEVVEAVAAYDCGNPADGMQNPFPWVHTWSTWAQSQEKDMDQEFLNAMSRMKQELEQMGEIWDAEFAALETAKATIQKGGKVITFGKDGRWAPIKELLYETQSDCVYFVSPDAEDDWKVLCAADPSKPFSGFSSRRLMPAKFRGLREEELSSTTGIPGCIFCHQDGFIAGFKTCEAAAAFANLCLKS